jgi:signal transduction histidine kinase
MDERELLQREVQRERAARRQAEDLLEEKSLALYQRNRELEREVAERRRVEASLRASAAELERRNAELGQFAHVASHDLQAPLRSIIGFSQLLQRKFQPAESGLDAEGHEYLQFIETSAQRLNVVIRDLLEFSAVGDESGEGLSASLDAALDRALADLAPALRQCAAVIERKPLPAAMAADKPMVQLLRNLIDTAATHRGGKPQRLASRVHPRQRHWRTAAAARTHLPDFPAPARQRAVSRYRRWPRHLPQDRQCLRRAPLGGGQPCRRQRVPLHSAAGPGNS